MCITHASVCFPYVRTTTHTREKINSLWTWRHHPPATPFATSPYPPERHSLRHATSSITVLRAKLLLKYNQLYLNILSMYFSQIIRQAQCISTSKFRPTERMRMKLILCVFVWINRHASGITLAPSYLPSYATCLFFRNFSSLIRKWHDFHLHTKFTYLGISNKYYTYITDASLRVSFHMQHVPHEEKINNCMWTWRHHLTVPTQSNSLTVLGVKLLFKYNQVYFKYFEYVRFQN
jgi:hypothetical protein